MQTAPSKLRCETEFVLLTLAAWARKSWAAADKAVVIAAPFLVYGTMAANGFASYQKHRNPCMLGASVVLAIFAVWGFSYNVKKAVQKMEAERQKQL